MNSQRSVAWMSGRMPTFWSSFRVKPTPTRNRVTERSCLEMLERNDQMSESSGNVVLKVAAKRNPRRK